MFKMDSEKWELFIKRNAERIHDRIESIYSELGYTQTTFGEAIGFSQGKISHTKRGANKVSLDYIMRAAAALNISIVDLVLGIEAENKYEQDDYRLLINLHKVIADKKTNAAQYEIIKKLLS